MNWESVGLLFGMFSAVITATWIITRLTHKKAYDNGVHSQEHAELKDDVQSAHDKLRAHDKEIAEIKSLSEVNIKEHGMILTNQNHTNSRLDQIFDILIKRGTHYDQ